MKEFQELYDRAVAAGVEAATKHTPTPMVVQQLSNPFDRNSTVLYQETVMDGVCGFAWVNIKPGNCKFANWLKKNNLARTGVYGGVQMAVHDYDQSMEKKAKHAQAMAKVFKDAGFRSWAESRMD